jgi:S1-C subfamily serine protease
MKIQSLVTFFVILTAFTLSAQNKPSFQSNPSLKIDNFLSGVQFANISYPDEIQKDIDAGVGNSLVYEYGKKYLLLGIPYLALTSEEKSQLLNSSKSNCNITDVIISGEIDNKTIRHIGITFITCRGDLFQFQSTGSFQITSLKKAEVKFTDDFNKFYSVKCNYDPIKRLKLPNHKTDWTQGELKGKITPTNTENFYKATWYDAGKQEIDDVYAFMDEVNMLNLASVGFSVPLHKNVKLFPLGTDRSMIKSNGSGFALSMDGLIVTNHHVIENANSINVTRTNGDLTCTYKAVVKLVDKNYDLAILQIKDDSFRHFDNIPYGFDKSLQDNGESIFVLGFPMITTMGNEVKLTNGIISSSSGYQGDPMTYKLSAPVQPGNSGGAVFDKKGNLIAIVNAKHLGAENVSYAIKLDYLISLVKLLPGKPELSEGNLSELTLATQYKRIKPYVFFIEIE